MRPGFGHSRYRTTGKDRPGGGKFDHLVRFTFFALAPDTVQIFELKQNYFALNELWMHANERKKNIFLPKNSLN